MEYKLVEYHRDITPKELLSDLKKTANTLKKRYLTRKEYESFGKYSANPYIRHFGSWKKALEEAGLETSKPKEAYRRITDEQLIEDIKFVGSSLNKLSISTKEYKIYGKYSVQTVLTRFCSWENALERTGLKKTGFKKVTDFDLFIEIERLWRIKGSQPTSTDIKNGYSIYSLNTYSRHFGSWRNALFAFLDWINCSDCNNIESYKSGDKEQPRDNPPAQIGENSKTTNKHHTSRDINVRLRFYVMKRDNFKCCLCGASPAKDPSIELHIDHIIPWSKGGETVIENLQTLCSKCNLGKSNLE